MSGFLKSSISQIWKPSIDLSKAATLQVITMLLCRHFDANDLMLWKIVGSCLAGASSTPSNRIKHLPLSRAVSSHSFPKALVETSLAQLIARSRSHSAVGAGAPARFTSRSGTNIGNKKSTFAGTAKWPEYTRDRYFKSVVLPEPGCPNTINFLYCSMRSMARTARISEAVVSPDCSESSLFATAALAASPFSNDRVTASQSSRSSKPSSAMKLSMVSCSREYKNFLASTMVLSGFDL